jgi:serine/threonine-protein kinase
LFDAQHACRAYVREIGEGTTNQRRRSSPGRNSWFAARFVTLRSLTASPDRDLGQYAIWGTLARGGMATVYLAERRGALGFRRFVALKRLHAELVRDSEFVAMFIDEARLAARIHHPNVVPIIDVASADGELLLVMEYVEGASLAMLQEACVARGTPIPLAICARLALDVLHGLHAAHEAKDEQARPLGIIHRDISPQNILVGTDGVARVIDFGVAKAAGRKQVTTEGQLKGKLAYMAPEQILGQNVTPSADVFFLTSPSTTPANSLTSSLRR